MLILLLFYELFYYSKQDALPQHIFKRYLLIPNLSFAIQRKEFTFYFSANF